ncbi:MAG: nucleotidyltransferase domain-containing protein [Bdellovibrionales bacterium]|nr:nucleotidyltransferase domain-containing protein [Bdellovibrionales bacterium]
MSLKSSIPKFDAKISQAVAEIVREKLEAGRTFRLAIQTPSMSPLITPGDVVQVQGKNLTDIKRGEVVCYKLLGGFGVHRVVIPFRSESKTITTRGERNLENDYPISEQEYIGVVRAVERDGEVIHLDTIRGKFFDWRCWLSASKKRFEALSRKKLARIVVRTQTFRPLRALYESLYTLGLNSWVRLLPRKNQVKAVFVYGSMAVKRIIPGLSDIDLVVIVKPEKKEDLFPLLSSIHKYHYRMMRCFPFISPPKVCTENEFRNWNRFGNFYFQDHKRSKLMFGVDDRPAPIYGTPIKRERDFVHLLTFAHGYFINHAYAIISGTASKRDYNSIAKHASDILRYAEQVYMTIESYSDLPISRDEFLRWIKKKHPKTEREAIAELAERARMSNSAPQSERALLAAELFLRTVNEMVSFVKSSFAIWSFLPNPAIKLSEAMLDNVRIQLVESSVQKFTTNKFQPLLGILIEADTTPEDLVNKVVKLREHARHTAAHPLLVHSKMFKLIKALNSSSYFEMRAKGQISELDFWQCLCAQLLDLQTYGWISGKYPEISNRLHSMNIQLLLNLRYALRYEYLEGRFSSGFQIVPPTSDPLSEPIKNFIHDISSGNEWLYRSDFCSKYYLLAREVWDEVYALAQNGLKQNEI